MRMQFDEQLAILKREMITMGMLCEHAISEAAGALLDHDMKMANALPEQLEDINRKEREIENICLRLLLQQQPVARDLRTVSSALKMVTDMERVGDQSADIAEIVTMSHSSEYAASIPIRDMSEAVKKMVGNSIDAFVKEDENLAKYVVEYDDTVDGYFDVVKNKLIEMLKTPGVDGEAIMDLLMIAKYFERIGDHAVNIAGWVIFSITGQRPADA